MSAESPVSRTDVASDGPATGDARPNHSGGSPRGGDSGPAGVADQPTRTRRNRRGRRRRGRRGKNPAQQPADAQSTPPNEAAAPGGDATAPAEKPSSAQPSRPKPGPRRPVHSGGSGGSGHPRKNAPPVRDGQSPTSGRHAGAQQGGRPQPGERPVDVDAGPKPSDLAARRQSADAARQEPAEVTTRRPPADAGRRQRDPGTPAAMPRTKRRNSGHRRPESSPDSGANANHQRLRTVRETSAGGLVLSSLDAPFDEIEAVLIGRIDRRGRMMWSLPKGHIETGETAETTAIREVEEETGVSGTIVAPLGKIDYWFVSEGRRIHKTVHHFLLRYAGGELSDADYEVSEVAWVRLTDLPRRLTYSDERRLARAVEEVVAELRDDPHRLARSEAEAIRTEPNEYEKAAAARNQRRNDPPPPPRPRRRKRRPRRGGGGQRDTGQRDTGQGDAGAHGDTASRGETGPATPDTDRGSSAG